MFSEEFSKKVFFKGNKIFKSVAISWVKYHFESVVKNSDRYNVHGTECL